MYKKSQLRILHSFLLISILLVSMFAFQGGDGTSGNPYNISTCLEFQNMSSDLAASYQLINDINCSGISDFNPIGNCTGFCNNVDDNPFMGNFTGNNYTISNIFIENLTSNDAGWGIFSYVDSGADFIEDIRFENITVIVPNADSVGGLIGDVGNSLNTLNNIIGKNIKVIGNDDVGGLGGYINMDITNVYVESNVSGNNGAGGLIGFLYQSGSLYNGTSISNVSGNNNVGGLVALNYRAGIFNSSSISNVSGNNEVGGLVGYNYRSAIINSYSISNVSGNDRVGGLVGHSYYDIEAKILNSYSAGSVSGNNFVGGLVGEIHYNVYINNSYSTSSVSGNNSVGGLVGLVNDRSNITNSFSTGDVTGINTSSTGAFVGVNDGDYLFPSGEPAFINNSFFYNHSGNPDVAIGLDVDGGNVVGISNLSYFYDNINSPFNDTWDTNVWNFTGTSLPFLNSQKNPLSVTSYLVISESTASLFPFGGVLVSLMLVLGFLIF